MFKNSDYVTLETFQARINGCKLKFEEVLVDTSTNNSVHRMSVGVFENILDLNLMKRNLMYDWCID